MAKKKGKPKNSNSAAALKAAPTSVPDSLTSEAITPAFGTMAPVMMKMCRLCEAKDGPFLNIFGTEQAIAKKIDLLLPFSVSEFDDLPHKICFRCSAKVEELHDFVQKCVTAQDNLRKLMGKTTAVPKTKTRKLWEDKLNQSNMTNDDICNAVIQKAMEGIKDLPLNPLPLEEIEKEERKEREKAALNKKALKLDRNKENPVLNNEVGVKKSKLSLEAQVPMTKSKTSIDNFEDIGTPRATRSENTTELCFDFLEPPKTRRVETPKGSLDNKKALNTENNAKGQKQSAKAKQIKLEDSILKNALTGNDENNLNDRDQTEEHASTKKAEQPKPQEPEKPQTEAKQPEQPFDIMKHICKIKVNGVGVLFQCKLCNRNFLKKEVVMTHGCAKTGVPKHNIAASPANVEYKNPINSVKYINNKPKVENQNELQNIVKPTSVPETKPKHKIGPASKTKKVTDEVTPSVGMRVTPREPTPPPPPPQPALPNVLSTIEVPPIPGLKSRYRLVPGPNNTFTLVEDSSLVEAPPIQPTATKRKSDEPVNVPPPPVTQPKRPRGPKSKTKRLADDYPKNPNEEIIDLDDEPKSESMPYPVGLFQTIAPNNPNEPPKMMQAPIIRPPVMQAPIQPPIMTAPATFTTPAMKKQSYTVVQTGNPSKLLISAKPQPQPQPPLADLPKPKSKRKAKHEAKQDVSEIKQPFNVTIEDNARPKDSGFFTFINVDPLLQPSYVLPTDNIIQESQISTSTAVAGGSKQSKDLYECSMCPEKFTREKKLLGHIQNHYNKMDEESRHRSERSTRKKGKKQ